MSLITDNLSRIKPGSHVRFTHISGQIIDGIVIENDGRESLSVQITLNSIIRYDQVGMIDIYGEVQPVKPEPAVEPAIEPAVVQITKIACDKDAISRAFKAIEPNEKKLLNSALSKFQSGIKDHDNAKCKEAINIITGTIKAKSWEQNKNVNCFLALLYLACGDFEKSAETFFWGSNMKLAYTAAYQGACDKADTSLYQLAAAFAIVYLSDCTIDESSEAMEILKSSSLSSKDISGFEYMLTDLRFEGKRDIVTETLRNITGDKKGKNPNVLLNENKMTFSKNVIGDLAKKYVELKPILIKEEMSEPVENEESKPIVKSEPDLTIEYSGKIVKYNFFEGTGNIDAEDGDTYAFDIKDITDVSLKTQVKKITSRKIEPPIDVKFMLSKRIGKYVAISIKRGLSTKTVYVSEPPKAAKPVNNSISTANTLFTQGEYLEALNIYKRNMEGINRDEAFSQIIMCYLALSKENDELGYLEELKAFVEKYVDDVVRTPKILEALFSYYMKSRNYLETIRVIDELMEHCDKSEHGRMLHYINSKARCYRSLKDYNSAISELLDWLDIVKKNKLTDRRQVRDTQIYIELAELYYEIGDYENAKKYANLSDAVERKSTLLDKLSEIFSVERKKSEIVDIDVDSTLPEPEESLQSAYESYNDDSDFSALGIDDIKVLKTATGFKQDQLYCLLTYLNSASELASKTQQMRMSDDGEIIYVAQAVKAINAAYAYAFNSPYLESDYNSTEIMTVFDEAKKYIHDAASYLIAATALYALFNTPASPDYNTDDFPIVVEMYSTENSNIQRYNSLIPLLNNLAAFRTQTGYGMDSYSDYKTGSAVLERIITEAKACCEAVDLRNDVFESQGQVRRMREFMFSSKDSELRTCLDIVASNDVSKYQYVKNTVLETFIRTGKSISANNIDIKKIDKYIDKYWDMARDAILGEGRHIERPYDKIKSSKRTNVVASVRRILACVCDWLAAAEHENNKGNAFAQSQYNRMAPQIMEELSSIIKSCDSDISENGFSWGVESLRLAASDLISKMEGTYNGKTRKYFFIDFLRGEDILLNDNYFPETESTFCGMSDYNILWRIEHHAAFEHPTLSERLSEILSNEETKHNFRSATLIKTYGEMMNIEEIVKHKNLPQFTECLNQAKQRFETMYQDFSDELKLYESYGTLSNYNGEKDKIMAVSYAWYRITRVTCDYGFYVRLLESIRKSISLNAAAKGESLLRQLEKLADNPEYDFGIFNKEMIAALINDQNYTSAEYIMSRIPIGDVNAITDYSSEPFGYFSEFVSEHATNYRAVRGAGKNIEDTIFEYSGKKDLEKALIYLTNNARKETKGGANLIKSWIPRGGRANNADIVEKLMTRLGFKPISVRVDTSIDTEAYQVICKKQIGKVNYVHLIPAFGSKSEQEGFRVLCLYGKYDCDSLMDKFREVNTTAKNTIVLLDFALNIEERRRLARKIKEEKSFAKTFILIDRVILFYLAKHYAENTVIRRLMAVTLPFAYYQPFVEASKNDMPPELFTGRQAELTSIESPEGANLVYGGRQLGKSALLKMAKHNIDKNGNGDRAVLIDIRSLTSAEAAPIVCNQLIIEGILDESCFADTWNAIAGHLQRRLMDERPETRINYLLLMLDEADDFIRTSGETDDQPITALKRLPSNRFKLVMAGLHNLSRYNREMLHMNSNLIHLTPIVIKQFRREEATKLLTCILAYLGFRFNQIIIDNILASTYNYPGLIQFYCQKLLEAMKNEDYAGYSESRTPYYEVTENHYKKVLSDTAFTEMVNTKLEASLFTEEEGHSNYHIMALIIAYLYCILPNEKGYTQANILKVAEEYQITRVTSLRPEQFDEILNEMWDLNILTVMDGYYRFATEGFRKLLGNQDRIEKSIEEYFEESDTI